MIVEIDVGRIGRQRAARLVDRLVDGVKVRLDDPDRFRVEVRVAVWHADDVLVLPAGALFREGNAWKTYVFNNGTAKLTPIEAGHSDGRFTEILSGINAGDEVLLHPPDTVKDGTSVRKRGE